MTRAPTRNLDREVGELAVMQKTMEQDFRDLKDEMMDVKASLARLASGQQQTRDLISGLWKWVAALAMGGSLAGGAVSEKVAVFIRMLGS